MTRPSQGSRRAARALRVLAALAGSWTGVGVRAGEEPAAELQHHASTAGLDGVQLLVATLYNDHRVLYAVATTLTMAAVATAIAFAIDAVLERLGVGLSRGEHRE
jgi:hypothetical protein